tara:strand:- start:1474 stop:1647 length:174 start_codon:yes stop_codon:yes gene_type:complete
MPRVAQQIANLQRANRNSRVLKNPKKPAQKKPAQKKPAQKKPASKKGTKTGKTRVKK